ncbi:MAG: glycosyltransferase family 9 protein [Lysobacterales bacterium]
MAVNPQSLSVCILRLSALGDVSHVLPLVYAWRQQRPQDRLSWVLGAGEAQLLAGIEGVSLLPYRKRDGLAGMRALWRSQRDQTFDALLVMQLALRANVLGRGLRARRRIGYDRLRSREGHSLFINERIADHGYSHVLETLCRFGEALGVVVDDLHWPLVIPDEAHAYAESCLPSDAPLLGISACSSHALRSWSPQGYAELARHAHKRHGMRVVLLGGRSDIERQMADTILGLAPDAECVDLVGKDTLKQMLALLSRMTVVVSPDAGPAHLASALGVPVIGLHAATDPRRSGPYRSLQWCVNRFPEVVRAKRGQELAQVRWSTRIEYPGVMDLIEIDEVLATLDRLLATPAGERLAPARLRR